MSIRTILGLDPGLNNTGWGIIRAEGSRLSFIACGTIKPDKTVPVAVRLVHLEAALQAIVEEYRPTAAAVEEVYVNNNARTSLKLGQARGVCLLIPQKFGLEVAEYTPAQVKKSVVGGGRAAKEQIAYMIKVLLPTARPDSTDAADALALAITHAHMGTYS
jgi:crossover junction endodeoxyribonuclease RuvC